MSDDWRQTTGLDQRLVERCQNLEARVKELGDELHFVKQKFVYVYPDNEAMNSLSCPDYFVRQLR